MSLPTDAKARKETPVCTGVLDYFPDALAAVAVVSRKGNERHNPGEPLHWSREKSSDHRDCIARHLIDAGNDGMGVDENGDLHLAACAWRALAALQLACEAQNDMRDAFSEAGFENAALCGTETIERAREILDNPWREWKGGEYPPCAGDKLVEIKMAGWDYTPNSSVASRLRWKHVGYGSDIVAWRFA